MNTEISEADKADEILLKSITERTGVTPNRTYREAETTGADNNNTAWQKNLLLYSIEILNQLSQIKLTKINFATDQRH